MASKKKAKLKREKQRLNKEVSLVWLQQHSFECDTQVIDSCDFNNLCG